MPLPDVGIWAKWTPQQLGLPSMKTIAVKKTRWLRKLELDSGQPREVALGKDEKPLAEGVWPVQGCHVELTTLAVDGRPAWWTLGFEAFGAPSNVAGLLQVALKHMEAKRPPSLADGVPSSYPAWIRQFTA